ncbi:MAG: hypothetical protein H6993_16615 [Pseudomonadales bacterium]|nr:hypothetical protein [Pseudomonadales bacterium]MCP5185590.1 hypothetical protein [Pseudomonadales bacterium]
MSDTPVAMAPAVIHPCPRDENCRYCNGTVPPAERLDWHFLDAAWCICLQSRDDRATQAAQEFHRVGLCQLVSFYRPARHPQKGIVGSWESHRAVARLAQERGTERTLVCEDDVLFDANLSPSVLARVAAGLESLGPDWNIYHLGHWPLRACFVHPHVLKTASACAHAYVASPRLTAWLAERPYGSPVAMNRGVGKALDAAFAKLPEVYAYFPMIAIQRVSRSDNFVTTGRRKKKLRHFVTRSRYREWLLCNLMKPSEIFAVLVSPVWWLVDRFRGRFYADMRPAVISPPKAS